MGDTVFIVGLTGGIGSGKSVVATRFAQYGVRIVDTDILAHQLTSAGGAAMPAILNAFGPHIIQDNGDLNRAAMRDLIFKNPAHKQQLESILHPLIRQKAQQCCAESRAAAYIMLAIPLLIEAANCYTFQRILVVDCPEEMQIARVMARSGLQADEVRAIMATQATRAERLAIAHDVIDNTGDLNALDAQVETLHHRYLHMRMCLHKA